ncbi:mechanosensitive ion channel domain-containing protein [Schaalia sp. ZJ405]|uniref:mechanosensitive ion channel domain-containing protein n=1 Tax=Schaalia sp. ZJ405 TaxID=2709403 RepID=UPI001E3EED86|nr:mechanosensitive ion channel domain-containing protein [Schaalia sp. ZJ405]
MEFLAKMATMSAARVATLVRADATDMPQSGAAEETVQNALDIASLLLWSVGGIIVGFLIATILVAVLKRAVRKWRIGLALIRRIRTPLYLTIMVWGAWVGLQLALRNTKLSDWSNGALVETMAHIILIAGIAGLTAIGYRASWIFQDAANLRQATDGGRARRFETQAQVVRRLIQVVFVIVGAVAILSTFEAARQAMTTLLASAGLISVIAGLAAQQTLGNVFAGLQLAFTDAIRVGDVVVADAAGASGAIEEITLSYVVVRIWDERRLIVPSTYFTSNSFENWTRRETRQLGTVTLQLDWAAPMTLIRSKVEQLLTETDLWDGRTWAVQMTDSDHMTVTVRILVSAKDSGSLWDLRCFIREQLVSWVVNEEPWARPASRYQRQETITIEKDESREKLASLAQELSHIADDDSHTSLHPIGGGTSTTEPPADDTGDSRGIPVWPADQNEGEDAIHAARLVAARRKSKRARRRAMEERRRDLAEGTQRSTSDSADTVVMSKTTLMKLIEGAPQTAESSTGGTPASSSSPETPRTEGTGESAQDMSAESAPGKDSRPQDTPKDAVQTRDDLTRTIAGKGERLYSGSPDAEERSQIFSGPGEEVLAERQAAAKRQAEQARRQAEEIRRDMEEAERESAGDASGEKDQVSDRGSATDNSEKIGADGQAEVASTTAVQVTDDVTATKTMPKITTKETPK